MDTTIFALLFLFSPTVFCASISSITPHYGSLNGATKITIWGQGFAANQFNFADDSNLGNKVNLVSETRNFECDILRDECTTGKVVCHTRPMPEDNYYVRLSVDGIDIPQSSHCNCNGFCYNCIFRPRWVNTPSIQSIDPKTALPGSIITIWGNLYTALYGTNIEKDDHGRTRRIKRVYVGGSKCELRDPDAPDEPEINDELYGLELNNDGASNYGYLKCKIQGSFVGNVNITIIVDEDFGRSIAYKILYDVKSPEKIAMFQTYAAVDSIYPTTGSLSGGTRLTISGRFFDETNFPAEVLVGGETCEIESLTSSEIVCFTPSYSDVTNSTFYSGNRGVNIDIFRQDLYTTDLSAVSGFTPDGVATRRFSDSMYFHNIHSGRYNARLQAFFVPPKSCNYTFYGKADDAFELYFSSDGPPENMVRIAYSHQHTVKYSEPTQKSDSFYLTEGKPYFMEVVFQDAGGADTLNIAALMHESQFMTAQSDMALNEKQKIVTKSSIVKENQMIQFNGWPSSAQSVTKEVQKISFSSDFPENFFFRIGLYGVYTVAMEGGLSANDIKSKVNDLLTLAPDTVNIAKTTTSGGFDLTVTFNSNRGDWPDLDVAIDETSPVNATFTVSEETEGVPKMTSYVLTLGGVPLPELPESATATEVETALNSALTVRCPNYILSPTASIFFQDFETSTSYEEYGTRTSEIEPFCGGVASRNPKHIFSEGAGSPTINAFFHRYICFAYFGKFRNKITIKYNYFKLGDPDRHTSTTAWDDVSITEVNTWGYTCIDMKALIASKNPQATSVYLKKVSLTSMSEKYFVDTITIAATPVTTDLMGASKYERLRPYDWGIKLATVTGNFADGLNVTFDARSCHHDFPLLAVEGMTTSMVAMDTATYAPGGTTVDVIRSASASMPPSGTFSVSFGGHQLDGVQANFTETEMQLTLETITDIGSLKVTRTGRCSGYEWTIEWLTRSGDQPLLEIIDTSSLGGTDAMVSTEPVQDGGIFFDPIPGDMLRTANTKPQVSVKINNIASICPGNCSFEYTTEATPTLTDIEPSSGSSPAGTSLTITGIGFDDVNFNNTIVIGGVICDVTTASSTSVECDVGQGPAGTHDVFMYIEGKGAVDTNNQTFLFTYDFDITGFEPAGGSTAGGQELTITGTGFGPNMTATVGSECEIVSANYSVITCLTSQGNVSQNVSVSNGETSVTFSTSSYDYDSSITPQITALNSTKGTPIGGETILISGLRFGSSADSEVFIGSVKASIVDYTDTEINVTLPGLSPGQHDVMVRVEGIGYADNAAISPIDSVFEVSNVFPTNASQAGGTILTITGQGFHADMTDVTIADKECSVVAMSSTEITCESPEMSNYHKVTNQGVHPTFGQNYAWLPSTLHIEVGDVATWSWMSPERVTTVGYAVHQMETPTSEKLKTGGFTSGAKIPMGSFSYKFNKAGTYYYWSGNVNNAGTITMRGTVIVHQRAAVTHKVMVTLNGYEAKHTMNGTNPNESSSCGETYDATEMCSEEIPPLMDMDNYYLTTSRCNTPLVTSVKPNIATADDVFYLSGEGFSDVFCQNMIKFGDVVCNVTSANSTLLTCEIDKNTTYAPGAPLEISVAVKNLGNAVIQIEEVEKRYVFLLPMITSIEPEMGSVEGQTTLTITGSGFGGSQLVQGNFNGVQCNVTDFTADTVTCTTGKGYAMSNVSITLSVYTGSQWIRAECRGRCQFSYDMSLTPLVTAISLETITAMDSLIVINGTGFSDTENRVSIGGTPCTVSNSTSSEITCYSGAPFAGNQPIEVIAVNKGKAVGDYMVSVEPSSVTISPRDGSTAGGQHLTITGFGFMDDVTVEIGGEDCEVISKSLQEVICITPAGSLGSEYVEVTSNDYTYPSEMFNYSSAHTPTITLVTPSSGFSESNIVLSGTNFGTNVTDTSVVVGGIECAVTSVDDTSITFTAAAHSAGLYMIDLQITSLGRASNSMNFTYDLGLSSISPTTGSFAGGQNLTVNGFGFDEDTVIEICNHRCEISSITADIIYCFTPSNNATGSTEVCDTSVTSGMAGASLSAAYTYDDSLTPEITDVFPKRGGTGGGTNVTITGTGFGTDPSTVTVSFAGTDCQVWSVTNTEVVCTTEAHSPSVETKALVEVNGYGTAKQTNADFQYIDVWSSRFTWGGSEPPVAGDFVIIPSTMTVLLDTVTPVLAILLIDGGKLIFDEKDVELHAEKILVTNGGVFQVGTEDEPFMHKATIMLHGHVRSQELPIYGTKMLAVRNGTLDLHGIPHDITWTLLNATANAGDSSITLQLPVNWDIGDEIVIATTGLRHTQAQTEVRTIIGKSGDNYTLNLDRPLEFEHLGETLSISGGYELEARAEVGLLTRNIVVRGNNNPEWNDEIEACPDGFNTGEFAVQTCFQGRFGDEIGTDEFGSQIMISTPYKHSGLVTARISNIEVTHAGQAYRLGRYAIHFHLNGDMSGSYVKNCAIHKSFNRAINIHATNYVLVENNVIYDVMGGALFLEDGIEIGNVFQYNLALFVKASTSLQNDDITPAAFWVTNANNTYRHNHAAGGTHFGFWYRMHARPDGASFDPNYCPQKIPMAKFFNNTVHSQGWFGIWIFQEFYPMENGRCSGDRPIAAKFEKLTAWNNEKGAEWVSCGAVQFIDFFLVNNEVAGIEMKLISQAEAYSDERGAALKGGVIAASPDDASVLGSKGKSKTAVLLPYSRGLGVHNMTFVNFDGGPVKAVFGMTSITGTSSDYNGGFTYKLSGLTYINSAKKIFWRWVSEGVLQDLDGSTCGSPGCSVVPNTPTLPPASCSESPDEFSVSGIAGAVCDNTVSFHRWAFNNPKPESFHFRNVTFTNDHGTTISMYAIKRVTHKPGWHTLLITGDTYVMQFNDSQQITNISFTGTFYNLAPTDYVIFQQNFTQRIDRARVVPGSGYNNASETMLDANSNHGDWYIEDDSNMVSFIVSGKPERSRRGVENPSGMTDRQIDLDIERCFYQNCYLPLGDGDDESPQSGRRLQDAVFWDEKETWADAETGWGGNYGNGDYGPPMENENVIIPAGKWVVLRSEIPLLKHLYVYGVLEFEYLPDRNENFYNLTLSCTHIVITGRLIVGWKDDPFLGKAIIELRGDHLTPDIVLSGGSIGSKVIAAFGGLEIHGKPQNVTWTRLAKTAASGTNLLKLTESVDWNVGDEIVITPSGYTPWEIDVKAITAISEDGMTLTLNESLQFSHTVNTQNIGATEVYLGCEVGLLTRNVKIVGANYPKLIKQSFGARILIGTYFDQDGMHTGYAKLSDFECYHCGQEGWTDHYDPRYSLAFLNTGDMVGELESYVVRSSFFHSFSPSIGLFGANQVRMESNVIYHTVGSSIIDWSVNNIYRNNLVTLVVFPGTYNDRVEKKIEVTAAFEIQEASLTILENNVVAGSERAGFRTVGEPCTGQPNPAPYWTGNVAHSALAGVALMPNDRPGPGMCSMWSNFTTYRCFDYGFYYQSANSFELVNAISVDNQVGLYDMVLGPPSPSHMFRRNYITVRDSVFVGTSDGFDCKEHIMPDHQKDRRMLEFSAPARSWQSPSGGRVGLAFPTFSSSGNNAPEKPFANIMAYNALYGIKHIVGTTLINFASACGSKDFAITTMPKNDDLTHPVRTAGLTLINVEATNRVFIHRPNLGKVNPADCVDMDCDAYKKCILTDSDGTLLGQRGTVLSQSEWQWNGDRRRGLGDYRIPKTLLTTPDGARIDVMDIAPEKGIIRDKSCVVNDNMQAWVCDDNYDYQMALVESMDSDTETRRVSPVAILGDGYLDLINGPQDHGWCFGYTCQKRLSTFGLVVVTGKTYEVHFTGTTPQDMRLHLLNSMHQQAYIFKIFYAVPMRLDVFVAGRYIVPKNAVIDGTGQQVTVSPSFEGEYDPNATTDPAGTNFWDPVTDLLHVLVRGDSPVDIKTSELIVIAFGVPAMTVDDFFGENLVNNLALFLGIPADKIKVARATRESRRRLLSDTIDFIVEISNPPSNDTSSDGSPVPPDVETLDSAQFANVTAKLINAVQLGMLDDVLNTTLSDISITEPVPDSSDPSWATITALFEEGISYSLTIQVPDQVEMMQSPSAGREYSSFEDLPILHMLDTGGNHVSQLGSKVTPWEFEATLTVITGSSDAFLTGDFNIESLNGWANFTTLGVSHAGTYQIDVEISSPPEAVGRYNGVSFNVEIEAKTLTARFMNHDAKITENDEVSMEIEILDDVTNEPFRDIFWKGHRWFANVTLHMPEMYVGEMMGDVTTEPFNGNTSTAEFNVSLSTPSRYFLHGHVWSVPENFRMNIVSDAIDVVSANDIGRVTERSTNVMIRFPYDYDLYASGKETYFTAAVMNQLVPTYTDVSMDSYSVTRGSILFSFTMSGTNTDVANTISLLESQCLSGFTVVFNGNSLTADSKLYIDESISDLMTTTGYVEKLDDTGLAMWEIVLIVLACILVVMAVVIMVVVLLHKKNKRKFILHSETSMASSAKSQKGESVLTLKSFSGENSKEGCDVEKYVLPSGLQKARYPTSTEIISNGVRKRSLPLLNETAWGASSDGERRKRQGKKPIFDNMPSPVLPLPVEQVL